MADEKLILYGETRYQSPYVLSSYVMLKEKGVPFEFRLLSLHDQEHIRTEYRDHSLTGRVPSLQHGDFWLSESSAIDEYLEDIFPAPQYPRLYPESLREKARARQIQAWLRSDLLALREERPTSSIFLNHPVKPLTAAGQTAAERLLRVAGALVKDGATSVFENFTVIDADLAVMLHRLIANGDPVPPKLQAYAAVQWRRPSIKEFVTRATSQESR